MTASEYMERVDPVSPAMAALSALAWMRERELRHLLVVERRALVGIVCYRDFCKLLLRPRPAGDVAEAATVTLGQIMTPAPLVTVHPDTHIVEVAKLIVAHGISCVPVVEAGENPIGCLSQKGVMAALVELLT